jgi:hypothetical protein
VELLTLRQVWERHFGELCELVDLRCGTSAAVMQQLLEEDDLHPDLVYIDGDHRYPVVRHDFVAAFLLAARPLRMLLDDYSPVSDVFGVRRLVDEYLARCFDLEAIYTDRRWHGQPKADTPLGDAGYAQILVDSAKANGPLEEVFPRRKAARLVERFRRHSSLLLRLDSLRRRITRPL